MSKKEISVLIALDAVLLIAAAVASLIALYLGAARGSYTAYDYMISLALVITAVFAVFYVLAGCKKGDGSSFFRWFMSLYALTHLLGLLQHQRMATAAVLLSTVSFGCLCILAVAKDLGKGRSILFAAVVFGCAAAQMIAAIAQGSFGATWFGQVTLLVLSLTTLLMVCAKYADKAARGRI